MSDTAKSTKGMAVFGEGFAWAVTLLVASKFIFSFQDVIIKLLSGTFPVHQLVFVRGVVGLPILLVFIHYDQGLASLKTRRPWFHFLRGGAMFGAFIFYYLSIAKIPITTGIAIFFTAPLFITALSIPVLGEQVGLRRWAGVLAGFAGVLIMLRPGTGSFEPAALLALCSAFFYAASQVAARKAGATESATVMSFYANMAYILVGGAMWAVFAVAGSPETSSPVISFLTRPWVMPNPLEFAMMCVIGLISAIGFSIGTQAYRSGEANRIAPFEYTTLIWASILSAFVWSQYPDVWTVIGVTIIMGSGMFVLRREHKVQKKPFSRRGVFRYR
ncbi:MAG: DMT family transporter [Pseudomonadota bacterium]